MSAACFWSGAARRIWKSGAWPRLRSRARTTIGGPVTIAGSAVLNNAEFVSGATLVQLGWPGAPVIHDEPDAVQIKDAGRNLSNTINAEVGNVVQGLAEADRVGEHVSACP